VNRIAVAAVCAAVAGLAACTNTAAGPAAQGTASVPVSCGQRYQTWDDGAGKGLIDTFHTVSVASTAGDLKMLTITLKKAKSAVTRAARHPVPACADPRGYWSVLLMHMSAAVASTGSAKSVRAAVKDVPKIDLALAAELKGVRH
jgi:hypothetical protein